MRKQQLIVAGVGLLLFIIILAFGNFIPPKSSMTAAPMAAAQQSVPALTTSDVLAAAKAKLSPAEQERITMLENNVVRGDVKDLKIKQYKQLASFWTDSMQNLSLGAFYSGEAAKLENSEQKLTFAARNLLSYTMAEQSMPMQTWMASEAKELFEQALKINPADDSAKVGIGGCYMFGNLSGNPMQEILKVREIAEKNPDNLYAQMMLGLGGVKSGQYDNAVKRFQAVLEKQPQNLEAIFNLAETYDRMQDKANAIKWYKEAGSLMKIPEAKKEIQQRIASLENE
ncbi:hypothetical protein A9P82_02630 [Arachidicoccus ginsenosidimutans]|uniref:tetratricopeptide repeat protein n=1 Tax=Arachidicoccus sp. BS20 TaxID=1850526 RepID=UPI0007F09848|nr:tetratricopeptide repeat protein [Arachidicoccus sp. BS20]ANI88295.1 hypothetical protein A9P82_02630 [Arachidicoccus sp. BS20]